MSKKLVASYTFSSTKDELKSALEEAVLRPVQCVAEFGHLVERLRVKTDSPWQSLMEEAADVIEKLTGERAFIVGCNQGYDTAMSQVTALFRLDGLRAAHAAWSQAQFGAVSAIGPAKHLAKEALEVAEAPHDVIEHADCWMLLWDMQRRAGISDEALANAIRVKLAENMARNWPDPKEGEAREHLKSERDEGYVIWSHEHGCWWRPGSAGYTNDLRSAGVYSRDEAMQISHRGRDGWEAGEIPDELPVRLSDLPKWASLAVQHD